ncbi:MAG: hypothetical protein HC804_12145 [Anaerolineae bacterium]|nr:hypothetical protein [Anaerolineae bacterium]
MTKKFVSFWGVMMVALLTAVTLFAAPHSPAGGNQIHLPIVLKPQTLAASRRVNVPYDTNTSLPRRTIFWFGRVDPTSNYADARLVLAIQNCLSRCLSLTATPGLTPPPLPTA